MSQTICCFILSVALNLTLSMPLSGQEAKQDSAQRIKLCPIKYTGLGKVATFRVDYRFAVSTGGDDQVDSVRRIEDKAPPGLINEEKLPDCLKTWRLEPNRDYLINLNIGTTSGPNSVTIIDSGNNKSIRIEMPF